MREDITRRIRRQAIAHEAKFPDFARELHEAADEIDLLRQVIQGSESYVTFRFERGVEVLDRETEWMLTEEQAHAVGRALTAKRPQVAP